MKKILYLMHIPWGWIKQRPHFFAEMLATDFSVDLRYKRAFHAKKEHYCNNKSDKNFNLSSFFILPFEKIPIVGRWKFFDYVNFFLFLLQIRKIKKYDIIWVTSILMYHYISPFIHHKQKLIYDCMDDEMEFPSVKSHSSLKNKLTHIERALLKRADLVFCSAFYLKQKVIKRTGVDGSKITILNNAIQLPQTGEMHLPNHLQTKLDMVKKMPYSFMYVGTIAAWFDFELIKIMLDHFPKAHVVLIGPNEVEIPDHEQIHYLGTIERQYIFNFMKIANCLFMPFQVNELIRSVNPVKLYEYIFANKPVIAPLYEETIQFDPYIYLYHTPENFIRLCSDLQDGKIDRKSNEQMNMDFVKNNVWEKRYCIINEKLNEL